MSGAPVYFLLHIPKTAGQTIQQHLAQHCAPGVFWQSRRRMRPGRRAGPGDVPDLERGRVIAGHHLGRSLETCFPGAEIRRVVLLRDPLGFHISFYNWQMMDQLHKGLGTYSFELHLRTLPRDFIAHFLLSRWLEIPWPVLMAMADERKYEILNRALAEFWFVGSYRDCDRVIAAIAADLGIAPAAPRRNTSAQLQKQIGWPLLTADQLSAAASAEILARNPIDQALWQSWGTAGFDTEGVRCAALDPDRKSGFLRHEIFRPWFTSSCFFRRELVPLLRPGRGRGAGVSRGNRARDARDWEGAARCYREALSETPEAAGIWVQYGHALKESGHVAEAEQAYRRSIGLDPDTADTHLQLGHALKLQGRIDEAAEAYLRCAVLDPDLYHAHDELIGLGWTAQRIEQMGQAARRARV